MNAKYLLASLAILIGFCLLSANQAFALGPVSIGVFGGIAATAMGDATSSPTMYTGYDFGAEALLSIPIIGSFGVEAEKSFYNLPSIGNVDTFKYGLVSKAGLLRISGGVTTISANGTINIGGQTFSIVGSKTGSYASLGYELDILGVILNLKAAGNMVESFIFPEASLNIGYKF